MGLGVEAMVECTCKCKGESEGRVGKARRMMDGHGLVIDRRFSGTLFYCWCTTGQLAALASGSLQAEVRWVSPRIPTSSIAASER